MRSDPTPEQILSASPEELVLLLFEGALRFAREGRDAAAAGDQETAGARVERVRAVIRELDASLDPQAGLVSQHLAAIYEYVLRRLDTPEVSVDTLDEVIDDIDALTQAWTGAVDSRRAPASIS